MGVIEIRAQDEDTRKLLQGAECPMEIGIVAILTLVENSAMSIP